MDKIKQKIKAYLNQCELTQMFSVYEERFKQTGVSPKASLRYIMDNEIVIEFDGNDKEYNQVLINILKAKLRGKYTFAIYSHGGKSPHFHIYDIKGLNMLDYKQRSLYRKLFILKYTRNIGIPDLSLTSDKHPIAMEFVPHFKPKHMGRTKDLIYFNLNQNNNELERELMLIINSIPRKKERDYIGKPNFWFINWLVLNKIPDGQRYTKIYKNLAIELYNHRDIYDIEYILKNIKQTNNIYLMTKGWLKWVEQGHNYFNLKEVYEYMEQHNIDPNKIYYKYKEVLPDGVR